MPNQTRQQFEPILRLNILGERPCLDIDCGFASWRLHFDDAQDLAGYLEDAVRFRSMPEYAATCALECVKKAFGHYDDF